MQGRRRADDHHIEIALPKGLFRWIGVLGAKALLHVEGALPADVKEGVQVDLMTLLNRR